LLDQQARRLIKIREAAARSKLRKHKIPEQVGDALCVMLLYWYVICVTAVVLVGMVSAAAGVAAA
jgi:hypothetical protein